MEENTNIDGIERHLKRHPELMELSNLRGFYKVEDVPTSHWDHGNWIDEDWHVARPVLTVWIENGDEGIIVLADATEPDDWDGTEPDEYERLEREICGQIGVDPESIEWDLK